MRRENASSFFCAISLLRKTKKAGENITTQPAQQLNIKKGKYKVLI